MNIRRPFAIAVALPRKAYVEIKPKPRRSSTVKSAKPESAQKTNESGWLASIPMLRTHETSSQAPQTNIVRPIHPWYFASVASMARTDGATTMRTP